MKNLDEYYAMYAHEVFAYIYSLCHQRDVAEDVLSETFYRAYQNLGSLKDERIKAWLLRVAYHAFIDHTRKEKRSQPEPPEFFNRKLKTEGFEEQLIHSERLQSVLAEIEALSFNQKQALVLSAIHQLSHKEIARTLEVSEQNVKSLIFRARAALKKNQQ